MSGRRLRLVGEVLLVGLVMAGVALAWRAGWFELLAERDALERFVEDLGPWGPVGIVVAQIAQVLLAPVPGQITGLVAGYLYGLLWGTVLCMVGLVVGTAMAMGLARRYGRPLVERLVPAPTLARLDATLERRGAPAFFLIFLLPFLPDDLTSFAAGLSSLRLSQLLLLATVGRLPGVVLSVLLGAHAGALGPTELVLLAAVSLVLLGLFWRYHGALERAMFRLVDRLAGRGDAGST